MYVALAGHAPYMCVCVHMVGTCGIAICCRTCVGIGCQCIPCVNKRMQVGVLMARVAKYGHKCTCMWGMSVHRASHPYIHGCCGT